MSASIAQSKNSNRFRLREGSYLRLLEESDARELHALIEHNRPELAQWMAWAQSQSLEQTLAFIRSTRAQIENDDGLQMAIVAEQARIVGMVGFHGIDWQNRSSSIGYWLDEAQRGKGIMTAAVAAVVNHAFESWRLNRVEIRADVRNTRSRAVAERLGFREEGVLRQSYRVTDGRYSDDAVYSLLASDPRQPGARLDDNG
jgi:ribosomal-protein-serine acetyltransferase